MKRSKNSVSVFLDFIDNRKIIRRLMLGGACYLTYGTWEWIIALPDPTTQQVAIFAAVNTILGAMVKFYNDARAPKTTPS